MVRRVRSFLPVAAIVLLVFALTADASACSFSISGPYDVEPGDLAFRGVVTGFIERPAPQQDGRAMWGLKVSVRERLLPVGGSVEEHFVYPVSHDHHCDLVLLDEATLSRQYPPGSSVWVVARRSEDGVLRVKNGFGINLEGAGSSPRRLSEYEIRENLIWLRRTSAQSKKAEILRRLACDARYDRASFRRLVERHLDDRTLAEEVVRFYRPCRL